MAPSPSWADLLPELLCRIGDHLDDLKSYSSARCACTSWRRALAPPSPALLVVRADADDARWCRPYAASLRTRRPLALAAFAAEETRCVGASDGWLALAVDDAVASHSHVAVFVLLHPVAAAEILLPPLVYESRWVHQISKVVFAPRPATDDFAAAAICDGDRVAYVTAGATRWAVMNPLRLATGDHLVDVVYADQRNAVYCLTMCGDVHVLRLPDRRRRKPAANVHGALEFSLLRPPQTTNERRRIDPRPLPWQHQRKLRTMHYQRQNQPIPTFYDDEETSTPSAPSESSQEPHPNAPATFEPLLCEANLPFNPATIFAPPYGIVSTFTSAKNLVFCEGNLYQVWRNESCTITLQLPPGGQHRVTEHEILVLRYYPDKRQPCWDVVKDLGGHSLFLGRNNAVSMYAKGVPGIKGNCVYWIGGRGSNQGMVFDMESGSSTPVGLLSGHPHSTICWYFLNDTCKEHQPQLQQ